MFPSYLTIALFKRSFSVNEPSFVSALEEAVPSIRFN